MIDCKLLYKNRNYRFELKKKRKFPDGPNVTTKVGEKIFRKNIEKREISRF